MASSCNGAKMKAEDSDDEVTNHRRRKTPVATTTFSDGSRQNPVTLTGDSVSKIPPSEAAVTYISLDSNDDDASDGEICVVEKYKTPRDSFAVIDLTVDGVCDQQFADHLANEFRNVSGFGCNLRDIKRDMKFAERLQAEEQAKYRRRKKRLRDGGTRNGSTTDNDAALAMMLQEEEDKDYEEIQKRAAKSDVYDVLGTFRQNVDKMLAEKAKTLKILKVEENSYSKPGQPLYNRFVEAWQAVEDETITLAFHGTAEENIDSICRNGLDPKRRTGQALGKGEYFGKNATISHGYCKGGRKMLVVAVLVDSSGKTCDQNDVLVIHKVEHQLPLFVVSF